MKRSTTIILAVACVALILLAGVVKLVSWATSIIVDGAQMAMEENPVIRTHLGEIEEVDIEWIKTGREEGDETFAFTVTGTKGRGLVVADFISVDEETEEMRNGTLTLDDGTSYSLEPEVSIEPTP